MRLPIRRLESYCIPANGSLAQEVETYVTSRVEDIVSDLPRDPLLEVTTTPRGDYLEVMIFAGKPDIKCAIESKTDDIKQELRAMGVSTVIYVRTWTGMP